MNLSATAYNFLNDPDSINSESVFQFRSDDDGSVRFFVNELFEPELIEVIDNIEKEHYQTDFKPHHKKLASNLFITYIKPILTD